MEQTHETYQRTDVYTDLGQLPLPIPEAETGLSVSFSAEAQAGDGDADSMPVQKVQPISPEELLPTGTAHVGIFRVLLQAFFSVMALLALSVYSVALLTEGGLLLSEGMGKIAAGELFGGLSRISVQAVSPPLQSESPADPITESDTPAPPLASLPANEDTAGPTGVIGIRRHDLSSDAPLGLALINETPYSPDLETLLTRTPIPALKTLQRTYGEEAPIVLILHTHGTEAFSDSAEDGYRTSDATRNILSLGSLMAEILRDNGIPVIHCTTLFDEDSFDSAYYNAALYIREILEEYPSISYIFDIHRDAITDGDNIGVSPYTEADGIGYAQMMFVVGTDHGGSGHTGWLDNLSLAVRLQASLSEKLPTLMRDINLRSASFNAQYAAGALLIEAGAAASNIEEAKNSIHLLSNAIAQEILTPGKRTEE